MAMDATMPRCLERIDASRNMARFYAISLEPTLFGDIALVREWGRIGRPGRRRLDLFPSVASAEAASACLQASKQKRGYCPRIVPSSEGIRGAHTIRPKRSIPRAEDTEPH